MLAVKSFHLDQHYLTCEINSGVVMNVWDVFIQMRSDIEVHYYVGLRLKLTISPMYFDILSSNKEKCYLLNLSNLLEIGKLQM